MDNGIYDDTYQNDSQISDEFKDDCLRVLPDDRLSTILNDAVVANSDEEKLLELQKQRENRGNMVEHEGSEYRKKKALMRRAKEKSKTGIKVTAKESIKSMMDGSKMHLKPKLEADDDSFSDGSEFELSDNVGKEADQDSGMEEEYLRRRENTPLQKDPNYAGNRAWTTRGSNVPMVLQLNDTLDANNRMGHSDREEIEDKKSIMALAPYSTNIVAEEGVVESNSVEGSNVRVRSLVDDIFEEDKWKVDELLQAVDSHIVAEEEIPADYGAMVDNSLEAKAVLHKEATESVHVETSGSSNSVDAPPLKTGDDKSESVAK